VRRHQPLRCCTANNDPPPNPDQSYFNYDNQRTARWGPGYPELVRLNATYTRIEYQNNAWGSRIPPVDWYWNEFDQNGTGPWAGILANKNPRKNRCEKFGEQSPIDIRESGAECLEHHQIRTRVRIQKQQNEKGGISCIIPPFTPAIILTELFSPERGLFV
jgi:hypothetical protein